MPNTNFPPAVLRTGKQLADAGLVAREETKTMDQIGKRYSVAIPAGLASLIDPTDPEDPIAHQFVPDAEELEISEGELEDPIGDDANSPVPGLVHRYPDRVLLMPTLSCPVYCRYCFRRDRVGRDAASPSESDIDAAIAYIEAHQGIREVILTGGDPLSLSDARLGALLTRLAEIRHLNNLRIHTRVPIVLPGRVTDRLINALHCGLPVWMVLHVNHSRELTIDVAGACDRLTRGGIALLSQSVLLRGVNADANTLSDLFRRLIALRVKPYYLHHPDRARGTSRFRLTLKEGRELVDTLRGRISGLCLPTYVVDIPGGYGKVSAQSSGIKPSNNEWKITDFQDAEHDYEDI
ncbi:MAG: lysine-2,3-aminomutase-like protein [Pseudomonadota bacterium]|nr:lysine-2,3-aminomutase-like protein [Pseudomonadota bacterium]